MKTTFNSVSHRLDTLNVMLDRPVSPFSDQGRGLYNVGHLTLDVNAEGMKVIEILSPDGKETREWSQQRMSNFEMMCFIDGAINGIALRNEHLGRQLLKVEQEKAAMIGETL